MTPLNWQEAPQEHGSHPVHPASTSQQAPKGALDFIVGIMSGAAFSLFLMGLIAGYVIGKLV